MAKKQEMTFESILDQTISSMLSSGGAYNRSIVDIITFCNSPEYLNFLGQDPPLKLWPMQQVVLKMYYRGTKGNEHVKLTGDEEDMIRRIAKEETLDYDHELGGFNQVLEKYRRNKIFTHLLLIMGRRSSKTTLVSIIAAYEAYKLLETPGGNPQKAYGIAADKNIHIINVAVNEQQALDPLFVEIESRIARSPYFASKINHEASKKGKICLLTDNDKLENENRRKRGMSVLLEGSIVLLSGHSNSASLRGHATICVLFDEFAHFVSTSGRSSGDEVYDALLPSMKQFGDDGKIVMLSDPRGKDGLFWKMFQLSQRRVLDNLGEVKYPHDDILSIQLPTWRMNPNEEFSRAKLEATEKPKNPVAFSTSFGARFMGTEGAKFFDASKIDEAIDVGRMETKCGDSRFKYYLHLDPATKSHNYALCMVHPENVYSPNGPQQTKIVVDMVKFWTPTSEGAVRLIDVEKEIRSICKKFRVVSVSFDSFQSESTIQSLRADGINAHETPYREYYLCKIYGELRNMIDAGNLSLLPHERLVGEMKCLLGRVVKSGVKRFFDTKSEYPGDDCVDALAGAVYIAIQKTVHNTLPKARLMRLGWR